MLLGVYIHTGQAEKLAWPTSPILCQLSYLYTRPSLFECVVFRNQV